MTTGIYTPPNSVFYLESFHCTVRCRYDVVNFLPNAHNTHPIAHDCLLNRLFGRRSKKTSKRRVTGLCEGNSPGTGEFPAQRASNAENVSIWWRHHGCFMKLCWVELWRQPTHWKQKIVNLTTLSSVVATLVVIGTTYGASSDDKPVKLSTFCFQHSIISFELIRVVYLPIFFMDAWQSGNRTGGTGNHWGGREFLEPPLFAQDKLLQAQVMCISSIMRKLWYRNQQYPAPSHTKEIEFRLSN